MTQPTAAPPALETMPDDLRTLAIERWQGGMGPMGLAEWVWHQAINRRAPAAPEPDVRDKAKGLWNDWSTSFQGMHGDNCISYIADALQSERDAAKAAEAEAKGYARGIEDAANLCDKESASRHNRSINPLPGDVSIRDFKQAEVQASKGITAHLLSKTIRALASATGQESRS